MTKNQIQTFAVKYDTNETVILREYMQLLFLQKLYQTKRSRKIIFKGGTAVHLIYKAPRFSEDLDFTVELSNGQFQDCFDRTVARLLKEEDVECKERESVAGRRFRLVIKPSVLRFPVYVNLDFSFREKTFSSIQTNITSEYPILFTSYVTHLSADEIVAEKMKAIMTRRKGRDLYDLWFLLAKGASLNNPLTQKKLQYYQLTSTNREILDRILSFPQNDFILDLRPFVSSHERQRLEEFFVFLKSQIEQSFKEKSEQR